MAEATAAAVADKSKQVWIFCNMSVPKDKYAAALEEMKSVVAETRKEKGCLKYGLHLALGQEESADPVKFSLFEQWESEEDVSAHEKSAHIAALIPKFGEWGLKIEVLKYQTEMD